MNSKVSHFIKTYKKFSKIPSPVSAVILPGINENVFSIETTWTVPDVIKLESTSFVRSYMLQIKNENFDFYPGKAMDTSSVSLKAYSKTGNRCAILQKKGKLPDDPQYLEIWSSTGKENTFKMNKRKEHGKICENVHFGCFEWSSNEKYLLYVAEMKDSKSESYFSDKETVDTDDKAGEEVTKGEEYLYREDWGEELVGIHHPVLCVLDVETNIVETFISPVLEHISVGKALWGPQDESIVFVGVQEYPKRLGFIYCTNRKSAIYSIDLKTKTIDCLSGDNDISVRAPRFSPDKAYLIYTESQSGGPHDMCKKLMKVDWSTKKRSVLVDIVHNAPADQFQGIYMRSLPKRCFTEDGNYFILSTLWRSKQVIVAVDTRDSSIKRIPVDSSFGACSVLDVHNNIIIASVSSPNTEPCLIAGKLHKDMNVPVSWTYLDLNTPAKIPGINWNIVTLKPPCVNEQYPHLDYEIIAVGQELEAKENRPLIVWPHGGPHSTISPEFSIYISAFVELGYAVCLVNYRGSLGFGEDSINSLLSNTGDHDVKDVHNAAVYMKDSGLIHPNADVILFGGSHGGFLVAHLSGQYPDFYKAAILRNPVINISIMAELSDIPDWTYVETGQGDQFDLSKSVTPDVLKTMWEKSPIKYINKVILPTLLLLGKNDLRVPPLQGLNYYHILKANNVPVSLYYYDDCHSLFKPASHSDGFMQIAIWLTKQLSTK